MDTEVEFLRRHGVQEEDLYRFRRPTVTFEELLSDKNDEMFEEERGVGSDYLPVSRRRPR